MRTDSKLSQTRGTKGNMPKDTVSVGNGGLGHWEVSGCYASGTLSPVGCCQVEAHGDSWLSWEPNIISK